MLMNKNSTRRMARPSCNTARALSRAAPGQSRVLRDRAECRSRSRRRYWSVEHQEAYASPHELATAAARWTPRLAPLGVSRRRLRSCGSGCVAQRRTVANARSAAPTSETDGGAAPRRPAPRCSNTLDGELEQGGWIEDSSRSERAKRSWARRKSTFDAEDRASSPRSIAMRPQPSNSPRGWPTGGQFRARRWISRGAHGTSSA